MTFTLNIVGYGYVGSALGYLLEHNEIRFNVSDPYPKRGRFTWYQNTKEMVKDNDQMQGPQYYFVCVPTPPTHDGDCDTSIVESVVHEIVSTTKSTNVTIIIKSTVRPGTTKLLQRVHPDVNIVFWPEFLRELTAQEDIMATRDILLGVNEFVLESELLRKDLETLFKNMFYGKRLRFKFKPSQTVELYKYTVNTYLAVKVWYFNEIYELCEQLRSDYSDIRDLLETEPRITQSHTNVPGQHGRGFTGSCLSKDSIALYKVVTDYQVNGSALAGIIERNREWRTNETYHNPNDKFIYAFKR